MSLREAYQLAHSAECRLKIEASRPDRNLRFLVGHLLHYENLRLRIVEIEHDVTQSAHANAVRIQGANDSHHLQRKPSTGQLGRRSPPPPALSPYESYDDDEEDDDDEDSDPWSGGSDEDGDDGLGLQRFPSASAQPPRPSAPEVSVDVERNPPQPDPETLQKVLQQSDGSSNFKTLYESVRKCPCHNQSDAPSFERVWDLPPDVAGRQGVTIAVAEVSG